MVLSLAAALYGQRLREIADWGSPAFTADFSDPGWDKRWQVINGGFRVDDGALVSTGNQENVIVLERRCSGPTAVEYDARIDPGSPPCDISMMWFRSHPHPVADGKASLSGNGDANVIQFGAYNDSYSIIADCDSKVLAYADFRPEVDRWYHMRVEVVGSTIQAWVDGERTLQWIDPFPLDDGYLAIYGHYEGKRFAHIRVFAQRPPELLPAIATVGTSWIALPQVRRGGRASYARVSGPPTGVGRRCSARRSTARA